MTTGAILGAKALLAISVAPIAEWTKISIKMGKDKVEVTNSDSGMSKEFLQAHKEWSYSIDCNLRLDDTAGQKALLDSWMADDDADAIIDDLTITTKSGGIVFSGSCFVTDFPVDLTLKGEQKVTITLQGTGPIGVT
jgi:predicted secreted protein